MKIDIFNKNLEKINKEEKSPWQVFAKDIFFASLLAYLIISWFSWRSVGFLLAEKAISYFLILPMIATFIYLITQTDIVEKILKRFNVLKNNKLKYIIGLIYTAAVIIISVKSDFQSKSTIFLFSILFGLTIFIYYIKTKNDKVIDRKISKKLFGLIFIIILSLGIFLRLYNIGRYEFKEDEFQVIGSAANYYHVGNFYKWDWIENKSGEFTDCVKNDRFCNYTRAWPHTWQIAQSFKLFGISEFSARLVSLIWGTIFLFVVYFFARYFFEDKIFALLAMSSFAINPHYILQARTVRMYVILAPIFLLLIILVHKTLIKEKKYKNQFLNKYLSFDFILVGLVFLFALFNYSIHINSLVIAPATLIFIIVLFLVKRTKRLAIISAAGVLTSIAFIFMAFYTPTLKKISNFITFEFKESYSYLDYFFSYPLSTFAGVGLFISLFFINLHLKKGNKNKIIYLQIIVAFSAFFLIYAADRYSNYNYASHIIPLAVLLSLYPVFLLLKRGGFLATIPIISILLINSFWGIEKNWKNFYKNNNNYGHFRSGYDEINKHFNPKTDILFGQYLRKYYLRDLSRNNITARVISMKNNRGYSLEQFLEDSKGYENVWVTWETRKTYHVSNSLNEYLCQNFIHLKGSSCDENKSDRENIEIFYSDKSF